MSFNQKLVFRWAEFLSLWRWGVVACLCAPTTALSSFSLDVDVGRLSYRSTEWLDGRVFNHEEGALRRNGVGMAWQLPGVWRAWHLRIHGRRAEGTVAYQGQTQWGLPLFTQTDLGLEDGELRLEQAGGWWLDQLRWQWGAGVGYQRIHRDIRATGISSRMTETLRSRQWVLHAKTGIHQTWAGLPWSLSIAATWRRPWSQTLQVNTHGVLDEVTLDPSRHLAWQREVELAVQPAPGWRIGMFWRDESFRPGASASVVATRDGVPQGVMSYPGSRQKTASWGVTSSFLF